MVSCARDLKERSGSFRFQNDISASDESNQDVGRNVDLEACIRSL